MTAETLLASWPMTTREVHSILAGTKTEHRLVVRPQPPAKFLTGDVAGFTNGDRWTVSKVNLVTHESDCWHPTTPGILPPFGSAGITLYVCEDYAKLDGEWVYRADRKQAKSRAEGEIDESLFPFDLKWKPAVHMPASAARLLIDVEHCALEQLRVMRDQQAIAEGVSTVGAERQGQPLERFEREFSASRGTPFDPNLWVWTYRFTARCDRGVNLAPHREAVIA